MIDLPNLTIRELLALHVGIADQLRLPERGVTRTSNNLTGEQSDHVNADKFILTDDVWKDTRVKDVTGKLRMVE